MSSERSAMNALLAPERRGGGGQGVGRVNQEVGQTVPLTAKAAKMKDGASPPPRERLQRERRRDAAFLSAPHLPSQLHSFHWVANGEPE